MRGDRGDIVVGWLTKLVVVLGLLGVVMFDAVSVGTATVSVQDDANTAATLASEAYFSSRNVDTAFAVAVRFAEDEGHTLDVADFEVSEDGGVRLRLQREATTLVMFRIGPLKKRTHIARWAERRAVSGS